MKSVIRPSLVTFFVFFFCQFGFAQNQVSNKVSEYLDNYNQAVYPYKVYLNTDKLLYSSGERIWLSVIILDRKSNKPVATNHEIILNLFDKNGMKMLESNQTLKSGTGDLDIHIPNINSDGIFMLTAMLKDYPKVRYMKELQINKNAIPSFLVDLKIEDKYYKAGDKLDIHISATDYFNSPLKNSKFEAFLNSGETTLFLEEDKLNKDGKAILSFTLPEPLPDKPLKFVIEINDNIHSELVSLNIPIQSDQVEVFFFPDGGQLVHGLSNIMSVQAVDALGEPFEFKADIVNEENQILSNVTSDENGFATIPLLPDYNKRFKLIITEPYIVNMEFPFPDVKPAGINFSVLQMEDDSIRIRIKSSIPNDQKITMLNVHNGSAYQLEEFDNAKVINYKIPKNKLKKGINQITLFDETGYPLGENEVFISPERVKSVSLSSEKENYAKREKADIYLTAKEPITYIFTAADQFRLPYYIPDQNIVSYVTLYSELSDYGFLHEQNYKNFESSEQEINSMLKITNSVNNWDEIYALNNLSIDFNSHQNISLPVEKVQYLASRKENNYRVFSNYFYDIYYLASNPLLIEKQKKYEKKESREPAYKKQLENGTPIKDVIFNMKPYNLMDGKIVFNGSQNSLMAQGGALIVIDGVKAGEQASVLNQLNPFDVDEINISTNAVDILNYTGLNSVGVIDIKTKRGEKPTEEEEEILSSEFEYVDHAKDAKYWKHRDDLRTTLYWHPFQKIGEGEHVINYFQSDVRGNFTDTIEGIDDEGVPFHEVIKYNTYSYSPENQ